MWRRATGQSASGFTAIELLVTVSVAAILAMVAAPSLSSFIAGSRLTSQANDFVSDIRLARSTAGVRSVRVAMCPSADGATCSNSASDWSKGRLLYIDANGNGAADSGEVLKITQNLDGNTAVTAANFNNLATLIFNPYGGILPLGTKGSFKLCAPGQATGRTVSVDISGRPLATKVACP